MSEQLGPDRYSTHQPALLWALRQRPPRRGLLELGTGYYSTPLFWSASRSKAWDPYRSLESDGHWAEHIRSRLGLPIEVATPARMIEVLHDPHASWGAALIDNGPAWRDRIAVLESLLDCHRPPADILVLHDANLGEEGPVIAQVARRYRYAREWQTAPDGFPTTVICSDAIEVPTSPAGR